MVPHVWQTAADVKGVVGYQAAGTVDPVPGNGGGTGVVDGRFDRNLSAAAPLTTNNIAKTSQGNSPPIGAGDGTGVKVGDGLGMIVGNNVPVGEGACVGRDVSVKKGVRVGKGVKVGGRVGVGDDVRMTEN